MVASRYTTGQIISKFIICACLVCLPLHPISHFTDGLVLRTRVKVRQSRRNMLAVYFQKNQEFSVPEHSCKSPDDLMCGNVFTCTWREQKGQKWVSAVGGQLNSLLILYSLRAWSGSAQSLYILCELSVRICSSLSVSIYISYLPL